MSIRAYTTTHICGPTAPPVGEINEHGGQLVWIEDYPNHYVTISMVDADYLRAVAKVATDLADRLDDLADGAIAEAEQVPA